MFSEHPLMNYPGWVGKSANLQIGIYKIDLNANLQ